MYKQRQGWYEPSAQSTLLLVETPCLPVNKLFVNRYTYNTGYAYMYSVQLQPVNIWVHLLAEGLPCDLSPYHLRGKVECTAMHMYTAHYLSQWPPL